MMKNTIIFDMDDTLYDLCWPFQMATERYFGRYGDEKTQKLIAENMEKIFLASRKYSDSVFDKWTSGEMSNDDMYAYRYQSSFGDIGIEISRKEALEIQGYYKEYQQKISVTDTVVSLLDRLKDNNVTMGVISNGGSKHQWSKVGTLGLTKWIPKENIFISGDVGVAKPGVEIFELVEKKLSITKDNAWYVGDTFYNDIVSSKNAGWNAIWFNHRYNPLPEGDIKPDKIVVDETEMAEAVLELSGVFSSE